MSQSVSVRPLRLYASGIWDSHDGLWGFRRHESDPHPKRWFVYYGDDDEPVFIAGHPSLSEAVEHIEKYGNLYLNA
jgi:hypothetical protein